MDGAWGDALVVTVAAWALLWLGLGVTVGHLLCRRFKC